MGHCTRYRWETRRRNDEIHDIVVPNVRRQAYLSKDEPVGLEAEGVEAAVTAADTGFECGSPMVPTTSE